VKVDSFTNFLPTVMRDAVLARAASVDDFENWLTVPPMTDVRARLEMMDEWGIDMQVLSTPSPPLDEIFERDEARDLARVTNDGMAAVVNTHPRRFIGTATLPLGDPEWGAEELTRAVVELGLRGGLLYSSVRGRAIDGPEFELLYATAEELDVPLWLHPERSSARPDYEGEERSRFGLFLVFGWPYETTLAMSRLVLSGVMQRHPRLKVIAHHAGAMIPRLANRIGTHYRNLPRVAGPADLDLPVIEYFKRFWVDTVTQGSVLSLQAAYELYGPDKLLFASDMPFGAGHGREFIQLETKALDELDAPDTDKARMWSSNALELCGVPG
jgi:predicted TIM-barrel fold metal-dependent hydrolase